MNLYTYLVTTYNQFLALFPQPLHWLISLMILIGLFIAFVNLIRFHWIFLLLLIILLPAIFPILQSLFADLYAFGVYLWQLVQSGPVHL